LDRLRRDAHVVELVVLAVMRDAVRGGPELLDHLHALFEDALVVAEVDMERRVFAAVISAARGEIDAAAGEQIERGPLFGDANGMMQRRDGHRRREANVLGARRDIGQHEIGTGQHAERVEMVLADPGRVHAELVGV
jgi:hypothetical protein